MLHRLSISVAAAAAAAVVILFLAMRAPSSRSGTAAAPRAPMLATSGPASSATSEPRVEPRGHTAASLSVAPAGDEASAEDRDLLAWVDWKYRYLLEDAQLDPATRTQLVRLVMARERLVRDPDAANLHDQLADIEHQLDALLGAADREHYRSLRDSETEQSRLGDYGGGIDHVAPLDDDQRKRLLAAKLRYKAIFERELGDAHLDQPVLSVAERARAYTIVNAALDHYRDAFLREAAGILDDQQIVLLTSYETTETERERQRLQIAINAR
ncbi:MAG TPA: hypothetical protein VHT91_46630 [Kofleriaceae bacterium]|nr:hypothetical protein [Kofleriaceae bacterium]